MTCQGCRAQTPSALATDAPLDFARGPRRHGEDALGQIAPTSIYRFKHAGIHAALRPRLARRLFAQALLPALLAFAACTVDNPATAGGSTETVNGHTVAMLYNPDGSPAVNAAVRFVPVDYRPAGLPKFAAATICSTTTDADGRYTFATVPGGTYNIFGELAGNRSFQDSVPVAAGAAEAEADTLRAPGSLRGYVDLSNGLDYKTVYALVFGSFAYSTVDSTGAFALRNLAEGDYAMRFFTTLDDWRPLDTVLGVSAGVDSVLTDTIRLEYRGIPTVNGLSLSYDTAMQIVTLSWNRADTAAVAGYNVYRQHMDSQLVRINAMVVRDTTYRDSTAAQDQSYRYQVKAVNENGNEGLLSAGAEVEVVSAFVLLDSIGVTGSGDGQFIEPHGVSVDVSGNIYIVDSGNKRILKFSRGGSYLSSIQVGPLTSGSFITNDVAVDSDFSIYVTEGQERNLVFKFDSSGNAIDTIGPLSKPKGIFMNSDQVLYVADANNHRIMKFSLQGDSLMSFGSIGSQDGQFNTPLDVVVDSAGNIYVSDANNRIQKFDSIGRFIRSWGTYGSSIGQFDWPVSLSMDSDGNIFVADYHNSRIQAFSSEGVFILEIQMSNAQDRSRPAGIAFDSDGLLYVTDDSGSKFYALKYGRR